jgi:hypothetical protein
MAEEKRSSGAGAVFTVGEFAGGVANTDLERSALPYRRDMYRSRSFGAGSTKRTCRAEMFPSDVADMSTNVTYSH